MTPPDVTVITVTFNGAGLVRRCLHALRDQELGDVRMRVVVVDNDSRDGTPHLIATEFPEVDLIRSPRNLGFAAGNNLALREVTSRWVVLLNNDAVPAPDFVAELVRAGEREPLTTAALAARVLLTQRFRAVEPGTPGAVAGADGPRLPDDAGSIELVNSTGNLVRVDGFGLDRGWLADAETHHPPSNVFGFSGAAALLRVDALTPVGLFDERLFMYYEDTDLSWRLRRAGFDIGYCERAVVHHEHSASTGEGSVFFRFHDARNRLVVLTKNASAGLVCQALGRYLVTTASILLRAPQPWRERFVTTRWRVRALGSYLGLLPHALRDRWRISAHARRSRAEVEAGLSPLGTGTNSGFRA